MYPDFQILFERLFGTAIPDWLSIFKTFGFIVMLSFVGAAWTTSSELKRKEKQGFLSPEYIKVLVGRHATIYDFLWSALGGFLIGFKVGGLFGHFHDIAPNPLGYLFSIEGTPLWGIVAGLVLGYLKYAEVKKQALPEPETKTMLMHPYQRMFEIVLIAAAGGFAGAKIFNAFETWDDFLRDPIGSIFSSSGLTFYGGLIVATIALYYYTLKHKIPFQYMCDSAAPGLMLAYGVGRLGCQIAGDGDWGIYNTAYVSSPDGVLRPSVTPADAEYATRMIGNQPHTFFAGWHGFPQWLFGMNYPHNVNDDGMAIAGCIGRYCHVLPVSVFPTPIYESFVCIILFFVLWGIRKKITKPLHLFGIYLILNGIERFFVELIRVNSKYNWGFIKPTQAEIIAVFMMLAGLSIILFYNKKNKIATPQIPDISTP